MLAGPQVDSMVLMALLLALAVTMMAVVRRRPELGLVAWMLAVAFVPFWMYVPGKLELSPQTALAVLIVLASIGTVQLRLGVADAVVAVVAVVAVMAYAIGVGTRHAVVVATLDWAGCYLLGRVLATKVEVRWLYGVVALVMAAAAALAVVEFATGFNPFVHLRSPWGPGDPVWAGLQGRGGIVRAEGAFGHSIAFGACVAMALPMALASRLPTWVRTGAVVSLLAGAVVSFSRIGIGTSAIGLALSVWLMRNQLGTRARTALTALMLGAAAVAVPIVERVFVAAGSEASGSADYRARLLALLPDMRFFGLSGSREVTADGTRSFGDFQSIDSAILLAGLTYGVLVMVLLVLAHLSAVVVMLRREPSPALIAVVAQIPAVATVAFITQYTMMFWFVAGLAVSTSVRVKSGAQGPPGPAAGEPVPTLDHRAAGPSPALAGPAVSPEAP